MKNAGRRFTHILILADPEAAQQQYNAAALEIGKALMPAMQKAIDAASRFAQEHAAELREYHGD